MAKPPRRYIVAPDDVETRFMLAGLHMLSQLDIPARDRVMEHWGRRIRTLPLVNAKGVVIEENPVDPNPPPILHWIHEQRTAEERVEPQSATAAES